MATYYTILTDSGQAALANAVATENPLEIASFVVGDSNGAYYEPTEGQTELVHQVWSGAPNRVYTHPNNAKWIVVEAIIPATAGGFDIREAGARDAGGTLVAVGKYPLTNKPVPGSGSESDLYIRMIMEVTNAASVSQTIDPSLVMATQEYVDRKNVREACRVATTANITLSGLQTIDGVTVVANDRVLVKNQATGSANGIYVAGTGAWTRALDADNALEVVDTMMVPVRDGTANGDSLWMLTTNAPITLGTTALMFRPVCGPLIASVQEQTGTGLIVKTAAATAAMRSIAGTSGRVVVANGNGVSDNPTIDLATSGVTAGTYNTVVVDVYGRATSGSNVTASETVAGFVELATTAEAIAGTDTARAVTPAGLAANAGASTPLMDGTAAVGTSTRHARDDHRHPTDSTRAPLASPTFTGTPAVPTAAVGTDTTQAASTAFVKAEIANDRPYEATASNIKMNGTQSLGSLATVPRADHVHPVDTSRQPYNALLAAIAGLTTAADTIPYFTGADTVGLTTLTSFIRTLLGDASATAARATLGVGDVAGQVAFFAMSSAPAGWLKANGAAISRTTYAALFAAIGTTYGVGDGSTTFNVPDLRGEFVRGWDDARGIDSGRVIGSWQDGSIIRHRHIDGSRVETGSACWSPTTTVAGGQCLDHVEITASAAPYTSYEGDTETRPRNVALLAAIKY